MERHSLLLRAILFLFILASFSSALIDPPVQEVAEHNLGIAKTITDIYDTNVLNCTNQTPTIDNPLRFYCVEVLDLTPSVNESVTASLHPQLIWAIAADNDKTFRENWTSPEGCPESWKMRRYRNIQVQSAEATYVVDGLLNREWGTQTFETETEIVPLTSFDNNTNTTNIINPARVAFNSSETSLCDVINFFTSFLLGDFFNLYCYEKKLDHASPYAVGVYNLTHRNRTIVNPHLNVTIDAGIKIPYVQSGKDYFLDEDDKCDFIDLEDEGNATFSASAIASYEVQNNYQTIIIHSPGFLNSETAPGEDVVFHFTLLSTSDVYKYYSVMDNKTAGAYYYYNFSVENKSLGIEEIVAHKSDTIGLLQDDPRAKNTYIGEYQFLGHFTTQQLRDPNETVNGSFSYNFSKAYELMDEYYNVSNGNHTVDLEFYSFFGNQTSKSNLSVRSSTNLIVNAYQIDNSSIMVVCTLQSKDLPLGGQPVNLTVGNQVKTCITDSNGICNATFSVKAKIGSVGAKYDGSQDYLEKSDSGSYQLSNPFNTGLTILSSNLGLMILLSFLFAFSMLNTLNFLSTDPIRGGMMVGFLSNRFYPFKPRIGKAIATGINAYTKQAAEVGVAVAKAAAAVATGGASLAADAGASAASQAAAKAAAKAGADAVSKKAMMDGSKGKMLARKGIEEKVKNKSMKKKAVDKNAVKKKKLSGIPGRPDDKDKKWLNSKVWDRLADPDHMLTEKDLKELEKITHKIEKSMDKWLQKQFHEGIRENKFDIIERFVAKGGYSFAEKFYAPLPEIINGFVKEDYINDVSIDPPKGAYSNDAKHYGVCMDKIRATHGYDKEAIKSCFIATTIHERLHHEGGFIKLFNDHGLRWLDEGMTESLSKQIMKDEFSLQFKNLRCTTYSGYTGLVKEFESVVGREPLYEAYFKRDFQILYDRMIVLGAPEDQVNDLLRAVGSTGGNLTTDSHSYDILVEQMEFVKSKMKKEEG